MIRKRDNGDGAPDPAQQEVAELRREVAQLRAELAALPDQLRTFHTVQIEVMQDLFNRTTVQHDAHLARLESSHAQLLAAARASAEDEPGARQAVRALRTTPEYAAAYTDDDPLVSVVIPTYTNHEGLRNRALPSVLAQTHANFEVVVVGDVAPPETAEAVASFDDPRLRYENLTLRGPYPDEPRDFWYCAGIPALNRGLERSRGQWITILNDDDAFRPDFIERLLAHARATRCEVAYGKLHNHEPDKDGWDYGEFPPKDKFGWQMALMHGGLRFFEYEMWAPTFDEPGDWNRARRMLRAGVQFSMVDAVVTDYWPSTLWRGRRT